MKRFICCLFAFLLLTGCASGAEEQQATQAPAPFMAGYAKVNITPMDPVPLGSYGNSANRISTGFTDYIYATALALQDAQGNAMVLLGIDTNGTGGQLIQNARATISAQTGIPKERVVLSASHMHSFPDMDSTDPSVERYSKKYEEYLVTAALDAVADLAPAQLEVTTVQTEGLNFVRRYELEGGVFVGYESDILESGLKVVGHETEADGSMQLVKFTRDEKKDILLANFQVHPHRGAGSTNTLITADLVGAFRQEVEEKLDCHAIYITGASGNINPYSAIEEENITKDHKEQGKALASYALKAEGSYTPVSTGPIRAITQTFQGKVDHSLDHLVAVAMDAKNYYQQTNSVAQMREKYHAQGINSPNHANMIINRSRREEVSFDIWAIAVGDVAFAVAPYEMFDTNGMFIKENSPFAMTVITTCANGAHGYLPTKLAIEHGGYEPDNTYFVTGSAEALADMYVEMLKDIH